MSFDKKTDDFVVRMPDSNGNSKEQQPFEMKNFGLPRPDRPTATPALSQSISKIDNNPGVSIMAYCLASISMTVVNKYCVSGANWNLNLFYLAVQSIVCIAAILISKKVGIIKGLAPFDPEKGKKWFPVSLLLVGMIYTGTKALQYLSVPVYTIFKNLTIIVIAYGEVLWFGGSVSPISLLAFGLMVLSSVIAAWADVQSALSATSNVSVSTLNAGYAWMGMNVICTSSFVLGMRKVIKKMNFKDWDSMFYNNFLTIPTLIIASLIFEDWSAENLARNFPVESRQSLVIGMIYSGLGAIFISYCSAWCIRVTSSTTYSVVGALNKLPIAVSGLVFFDAPVTFGSVSAIFLGFVSGIVYAYGQVRQKEQAKHSLPTQNGPIMSASAQSSKDASNS